MTCAGGEDEGDVSGRCKKVQMETILTPGYIQCEGEWKGKSFETN